MKKIVLSLLFISFVVQSCINEPTMEKNDPKGNFEALWKIIDTKYCYLDYKHIRWDSIHSVYAARVDNDMSNMALFDLLGSMLAELQDGHVNLYSNFNTSRNWKWFTEYPSNFDTDLIYNERYLGANYFSVSGLKYAKIANGKVGYIYFGDFSNRFSDTNMYNIFSYFINCEALIIDVRNNGGGYLDLAEQFASYFFKEKTLTAYIQHKEGNGHSDFSKPVAIYTPGHKTLQWQRPVAVLTNRMSYSATNAFVVRMKMANHAIIVGDQTGGGGGLPMSSELPNGWMVRLSQSPMFDADMQQTEWGITPDVPVVLNIALRANGMDSIIESAISLITKN
ncbi:MAG: peptidase S41 [Porphyromonadaceae bacterium CG2_30_38_12]|nr:MAG: peptidase S41 [Porphyromonadaceae bacterium CG2_30_38_12]